MFQCDYSHAGRRVFAGEAVAVGNVRHVHERALERQNLSAKVIRVRLFEDSERIPVVSSVVEYYRHRRDSAEYAVLVLNFHDGMDVLGNLVENHGVATGLVLQQDSDENRGAGCDVHAERQISFAGVVNFRIGIGNTHKRIEINLRQKRVDIVIYFRRKFKQVADMSCVGKQPTKECIVFSFGSLFFVFHFIL